MSLVVEGKELAVSGWFPRIASLRAEYYECVDDLRRFSDQLKDKRIPADIFTCVLSAGEEPRNWPYPFESEAIAVLPITSYDHWWNSQINDKTRNMVRKAGKKGVEIRVVEFNDDLIKGIKDVYDESPIRQGKPFAHYGKDLDTLRRAHISYVDRSDFIGAFGEGRLIGFIKLVHGYRVSNIMQIVSMVCHQDKAPTNALIAKAVEICARRGVPLLHYGVWSRRGLGSFKENHAFERRILQRYYVPLTMRGTISMMLGLHRRLASYLPGEWIDRLVGFRTRWFVNRYALATKRA